MAAPPSPSPPHFTPTSDSWMNKVERWFSELTTKRIRRGTHRSELALEADIREWIGTWNQRPNPFVGVKTVDEILASIARFCRRISETGHSSCLSQLRGASCTSAAEVSPRMHHANHPR